MVSAAYRQILNRSSQRFKALCREATETHIQKIIVTILALRETRCPRGQFVLFHEPLLLHLVYNVILGSMKQHQLSGCYTFNEVLLVLTLIDRSS